MIIVDYSQVSISTLMAELKGHTDVEINVPLVRHMIVNALRSYKVKFGAEFGQMVIACDSRRYWRKGVFPPYKASRKKNRDASGFDWQSIFEALNLVKTEIDQFFPYPLVEVDGAEADDVIASLVYWTQANDFAEAIGLSDPAPQKVMILSGDHDFQQLQKFENVTQYAPIEKKYINCKLNPESTLMEHIIRGDRGDGIPNFLSDDDCFVTGTRQKPIRETSVEKWRDMKPEEFITNPTHLRNFERNRTLVDLSKIPSEIQESIVQNYQTQKGVRNASQLLNYMIQNGMKNLIEHLTEF